MHQPVTITTDAEREAALARIAELTGCLEGSAEEQELKALADAVEAFERISDDASHWR